MKLHKIIITIMLLAFVPATLLAQKRSEIIEISEMDTNYSVETLKVGADGTKYIKVSGFGKNDDAATFNAKRNAVHAAIFRGFPSAADANATPAICTDPSVMQNYKIYFNNFFNNGDYLQYINLTTDGVPSGADRIKVKGGYEVKIYAQIMYDNLRRRLESDGIVKALDDIDIGKLPTIMVVPSDIWCLRNGYVIEFDNQGVTQKVPDYARAMSENADIRVLVSKMGDFMAAENFPIVSLEQELKRVNMESAELSLITGNTSGAMIAESPIEMVRRSAKADIILDLDFENKKIGPRTQISFNLTALDAYSSKIISGNPGVGSNSSAPLVTLLEEVFLSYKDNFMNGLKNHYNNIAKNGREIVVVLRRFDSSMIDFETEFDYNGQIAELADIVGVWFEENAVDGNFSEDERSANVLRYNQVMMPVYGKSLSGKEVAINSTTFVRTLSNMLKNEPYNSPVKVYQKGLGEVWLIIGEK
ncbi:MAG: DUF6175 family protein [Rikenellaceae bacterium]